MDDNATKSEALRRHGALSERIRSDVPATSATTQGATETDSGQDGFPCPRQIKPLLHFYKYLQPLPDGRKLQLQIPPTVVCDKKNGREEVLVLSTDANGFVVKDDKGPAWRKRLLSDFLGEDQQNAASLLSVGLDDVVAVRNVAHWRSGGGVGGGSSGGGTGGSGSGGANSKSLVLTRRAFDVVVSAPCDLAFSVQKYVHCRGCHASIFRVTWGERENRRFAINIFNEKKITEAPTAASYGKSVGDARPQGTASDAALRQMAQLSPYYLVTATSGSDLKRQHEHAKLPRIRGSPVADGLQAVKRMIDHLTSHLPGIKVWELTADFIKDNSGVWWFIRVMHFDAYYRIEVPLSVHSNSELDSAAYIHDVLRSKYFRQTLRTIASTPPGNCMVPQCTLCGCSCELPKALRRDLQKLSTSIASEGVSDDVFRALSEYRMTLNMAVSTLFQLRQRGESLPLWEHAALLLSNNPAGQASEFTVCSLCYRIYKSQLTLSRIASELHETYGVSRASRLPSEQPTVIDVVTATTMTIDDERPADRLGVLRTRLHRFYSEQYVSLVPEDASPSRVRPVFPQYTPVKGVDVDPTCFQMRLVFFFHELQDGGPTLSAADFYLEYHLGQHFSRLDFDGSKRHTPNRWQLCEARVHYLLATKEAFGEYCNEKRLRLKLKTVAGNEYHGHTSMSLRPLLASAKWFSPSLQRESRVDYLLELKTDAFGLLTLKMTVGLLVDAVPLSQVRELIKEDDFLREGSLAVFWPPPWSYSCSLPVPVDWVGALMPSEYISILPRQKRQHLADRRRIGLHRASGDTGSVRQLASDGKSLSVRFSIENRVTRDSVELKNEQPTQQPEGDDPDASLLSDTGTTLEHRALVLACVVAKRIMYRVAGDVATFPTVVIGHMLRHVRFLAPGESSGGIASWAEPALFHLTSQYTIDNVTRDVSVDSVAAVSVVGEILLVLLRSHLVPDVIRVAHLERTISPYWLVRRSERDGHTELLAFEPVSLRINAVSSQQRVVWNRAIRRCQVAHFCGEFRSYTRTSSKPDEQDHARPEVVSKYEEMQVLQRKMSYRVKMQAHLLCEIVEIMEAADCGLIDIAELRSLHKCMIAARASPPTTTTDRAFCKRDRLEHDDLDALRNTLVVNQYAAEVAFVECLMTSDRMIGVLAQFDRFGVGTMNFDEFWELSDSVLRGLGALYASQADEPRCTVFCLRHGHTDAFALDRCCVLCSFQYQDQEFLPGKFLMDEGPMSRSSNSDSNSDAASTSNDSEGDEDQKVSSNVPDVLDGARGLRGSRASVDPSAFTDANGKSEPEHNVSLATTLQQLKAAEWHIRYSRNSLDRTTLETVLSERRVSSATAGRKTSTVSTASEKPGKRLELVPSFSVTDFVVEAEERKLQALHNTGIPKPRITRKQKKKPHHSGSIQRPKTSNSSALHSTRLQTSHSLSTLLRTELEDASKRGFGSGDATRSTQLMDAVHRGEAKRNKLDRLVLAELDDVKQRLARLLASS